jgi:hypothetical protein
MGRTPSLKDFHMNKTVRITLRANVIREYTEDVSVPMSATHDELQAYARSRLEQVPSGEFEDTTELWTLESAKIQVLKEPADRDTLRAALDEQGRLCAYLAASKRPVEAPTDWPRGTTQPFWVKPLDTAHPEGGDDAWLFEVRDNNGNLLADRLIRGRLGLNLFYEDMVGYQPDTDEYRHDLDKLRDEVLEMFYRNTTNDPN